MCHLAATRSLQLELTCKFRYIVINVQRKDKRDVGRYVVFAGSENSNIAICAICFLKQTDSLSYLNEQINHALKQKVI